MNDFGLLAALKKILDQHPQLQRKSKGVYSHVPENTTPPYIVMELGMVQVGVDRSVVELILQVYSAYCGLREIQELLQALVVLLDGQEVVVLNAQDRSAVSTALLWIESQGIELLKDNVTRRGRVLVKALIRPLRR